MLEHSLRVSKAWGMINEEEVHALAKIVRGLPDHAICVNIGAGTGTSSLVVRESRPDVEIWTIDKEIETPFGGLQNEKNAFKDTGLELPHQILSLSHKAAEIWKKQNYGKKIDLLIVDGDHTRPGISGDIKAWLPLCRKGGIAIFHDYGTRVNRRTDVSEVVDQMMTSHIQLGHIGLYIWFQIV